LITARCALGKKIGRNTEFRFYRDGQNMEFSVSEFIVHPDWDPKDDQNAADIAIARLNGNIDAYHETPHVCLNTPSNSIQSFAGRNASVYGWGLVEIFEFVSELREVEVPLVDQEKCNSFSPISDTLFCVEARDEKTDPCKGNLACF
jgi:hypothetical protein